MRASHIIHAKKFNMESHKRYPFSHVQRKCLNYGMTHEISILTCVTNTRISIYITHMLAHARKCPYIFKIPCFPILCFLNKHKKPYEVL